MRQKLLRSSGGASEWDILLIVMIFLALLLAAPFMLSYHLGKALLGRVWWRKTERGK